MQTGVHTAARTPSALDEIRQESWVRRRIGFACAAFGLAIIVGVLGFSFFKLATQTFPEAPEHLALAVSVVIAEAAITIAGLFVGYSMLTVAERLIVDKRVLGVAMAARATKDQPRSTLPEMRGRMPSYSGMAPMSTDTQRQ